MDQSEIQKQKRKLEDEKNRLLKELKGNEKPEDFGNDVDGQDEEKNEAEEMGNKMGMNQAIRDRVSEIDTVLQKLEAGEHAVCQMCGTHIAPESKLCESCKVKS